ncbi:hypothetical protein, partial [Xenorhabdus bovienii]|uniref:hypothetical protein n=1 Tax=Xenorhabdus bovienii TaxID=40576 RepID=UPI001E554929
MQKCHNKVNCHFQKAIALNGCVALRVESYGNCQFPHGFCRISRESASKDEYDYFLCSELIE